MLLAFRRPGPDAMQRDLKGAEEGIQVWWGHRWEVTTLITSSGVRVL